MKLIEVTQVKLAANRQRQVFDESAIRELASSIQRGGLQHPIVLRIEGDDYVLVSGERRLRAITDLHDLGEKFFHDNEEVKYNAIPYTTLGELDPLAAEEAEWDENNSRVDLSWKEKAEATLRLDSLRKRQAAAAGTLEPTVAEVAIDANKAIKDPNWRTDVTRQQLIVARNLDKPGVAEAKTLEEAFKAVRKDEEATKNRALGISVGRIYSADFHTALNTDSLDWMQSCPRERFDVILTDPPYGMGADEFGDSGGLAAGAHSYTDSEENAILCYSVLARESFRITKETAHIYAFCDLDLFPRLKLLFASAGWSVFRTPLIWYKRAGMRAPWPKEGPQRKYETILYAVKGHRNVNYVAGDVLEFAADKNLGHAAQKPVSLFEELLKRSCAAGDSILDPFMGSGPIFEAAHRLKLRATGIEMDTASYGIALKRLEQIKASIQVGV